MKKGQTMPLGFPSLSHGDIAFGFFNVESDMLLLENIFFFADDFCAKVMALEQSSAAAPTLNWQVWQIPDRENMGDYRSFLGEKRDRGFWGEVYRHYPYPARPEEFHQKPEGWTTQPEVIRMISKYGAQQEIALGLDADREAVSIGAYRFSYPVFKQLILYVWVGGYPRWQDGKRPQYVIEMKERIAASKKPVFRGIGFATQ